MNPYIGDRQLDPDSEFECPYCGALFHGPMMLRQHTERCPHNNDSDPGEPNEDLG